jgi:hypothetical protein
MKTKLNSDVSPNQKKGQYVNILLALGVIVLSCLFFEIIYREMYAFTILPLVFLLYSLIVNRKAQHLKNTWPVCLVVAYFFVRGFGNNLDWALFRWDMWAGLLVFTVLMLLGYFIGFFALKWKVIQKNYLLTILTTVSFALAALAININLQFQFFAVGLIYLVAPCLACYYITQKKYVAWVIILPFVLLHILSILFEDVSIRAYPVVLIPIVSAGIYCLTRLVAKPVKWVLPAGYVVLLLYGWCSGMEWYFQWVMK